MEFTRSEIEAAIASIDRDPTPIIGRRSIAYNLHYRDEVYPPILILSIANQLKGGSELSIDNFQSTEKAFEVFQKLGPEFSVRKKENEGYSYVKFFQELAKKLLGYRERQSELIQILRDIGNEKNLDDFDGTSKFPLREIDPFTFFAFFMKVSAPEKRRLLFRKLKQRLALLTPTPDGFDGVPSAQAMKMWYFSYEEYRKPDDIPTLWKLAEEALAGNITNATFKRALDIKAVGLAKLTQGLFYLDPERYYPIDKHIGFIEREGVSLNIESAVEYLNALDAIRNKFNLPFYQLSHQAWKYSKDNEGTENDESTVEENEKSMSKTTNTTSSINQILFGPPGTGKTYHTITEALKIVSPEYYSLHKSDRIKLQDHFNELLIKDWTKTEGQIAFCTFHQSFSYEDFVEGIKPLAPEQNDKHLRYDIVPGIFKSICRLAEAVNNAQTLAKERLVSLTQSEFDSATFYKISLGDSTKAEDAEIYEHCVNNNCISVGFGEGIDFSGMDEGAVSAAVSENHLEPYTAQIINYFKNYLKKGDYVVVSNGNSYIRALGKVTGDYYYDPDAAIGYDHFREVEWIFKNVEIPVDEFYQKVLSQQTLYKLNRDLIKLQFFVQAVNQETQPSIKKDFVIIIDEINRGNVSSIFGELITLIEPTKRAGNPEALEVVLPYSKQKFSVPSNVHIIGTMNTADRSIESLDTALRRRFSFKEMSPNTGVLKNESKSKGMIDGIDLTRLLDMINYRLEKLIDKDHKIGHSYFMHATSIEDLNRVFLDRIIPLLEEYFFGDFGKIGLVLGDSFVKKSSSNGLTFAKFSDYDNDVAADLLSRSVYQIKPKNEWNYKSVYE